MGFTFKHFHVDDDRCGMKVGTDSVLLGCAADIAAPERVLDIGCGSGLLCLIVAQRLAEQAPQSDNWTVLGVELDQAAYEQALQNVAQSPWAERIALCHSDINRFEVNEPFDLIISNPPYFTDALASPNQARHTARHDCSLSKEQLAQQVARLLSDNGQFWLILPVDAEAAFIRCANQAGLYLHKRIKVHTKYGKPVHRHIACYGKVETLHVAQSDVDVYDENNQYSSQFIALTQNFYLNR